MEDDEFKDYDLDLRDLLDELVDHTLNCIMGVVNADFILDMPDLSWQERQMILARKESLKSGLNEISKCYYATIGYHD